MNVRDLSCWPPRWRRAAGACGDLLSGERGILIASRWDHESRTLALVMEENGGNRHVAVLEDTVRVLSKLALLLDWHIGRPLARIGSLEIVL